MKLYLNYFESLVIKHSFNLRDFVSVHIVFLSQLVDSARVNPNILPSASDASVLVVLVLTGWVLVWGRVLLVIRVIIYLVAAVCWVICHRLMRRGFVIIILTLIVRANLLRHRFWHPGLWRFALPWFWHVIGELSHFVPFTKLLFWRVILLLVFKLMWIHCL